MKPDAQGSSRELNGAGSFHWAFWRDDRLLGISTLYFYSVLCMILCTLLVIPLAEESRQVQKGPGVHERKGQKISDPVYSALIALVQRISCIYRQEKREKRSNNKWPRDWD